MNALSLFRQSLAAVAPAALIAIAAPAWAAPPSTPVTMQITVTPQQSVNGVIPTNPGNSPNAVYAYSTVAGDSLSDSIPVNVCITSLTDDGTLSTWSVNIDIGSDAPAGNLTGVDASPSTVTFSKGDGVGTCKVSTIIIASDPLQDLNSSGVDYNKNIKITYDNPPGKDDVGVNVDGLTHIKIMVTVNPPAGPTCFATDSDFNFLFACDGTTAITSGTDGRFAIVANRKNIEVATNPGQFYYNVLWKNSSGSPVTVNVGFLRAGVVPNGTQAIHAAVFPPAFAGADLAGFNAVNDAIPGGKADVISGVTVPAGWTLWVDYHLEWGGLGKLVPVGASNSCSTANQAWTVSATLTTSAGAPIGDPCIAGGKGYLKK